MMDNPQILSTITLKAEKDKCKKLAANAFIPKLWFKNTWCYTFTIGVQAKLPPHLIPRHATITTVPHK